MGKWTLNHQDDVLRDKIKSLVVGAMKRSRLEKGEPTITYESFVEELDVGDSFTTTMIDALVKEVADRRSRPHSSDRRMISERTAKTLRMQASALHIYRERRRYAAEYILNREHEHSEDDDEIAEMIEAAGSSHGAPALYDAYMPLRPTRSLFGDNAASAALLRESVTSPRPLSPPTPVLGGESLPPSLPLPSVYLAPTGPTALSRQRSVRRPARSRTMDFNDFTTRRRSIVRHTAETSEPVRAEDSTDGTWRFSSLLDRPTPSDSSASSSTHRLGRRFYPLTSWSDPHLRIDPESDTLRYPEALTALEGSGSGESSGSNHQSSGRLWYAFTRHPSASTSDGTTLPRLRRGGLQAPESLYSRYGSPTTDSIAPLPDGPSGGSQDHPLSRSPATGSGTVPRVQNSEMDALDEVSRQLLTPRSISPPDEVFHI